ncbi:WW domain-containing oxidoreductase [Contarinia nasturtii]|uniref:WW domain-containing oxidoreductase n=1 Tax=Contarinia nasturtii TaxID=265458 RepID=UPI0012D4A51E|nr:WW domain-containing oxidoreductase [Contarinia nasturtii]
MSRPPMMQPDSDSEDEVLPPGFEERTDEDGNVFYLNHQEKKTQWIHPRTGKAKKIQGELPFGWEKEREESTGQTIYIDRKNNRRTYIDPRLAFAVENTPKNVSDIRQRFDANSTAFQVLHGQDLNGKVAVITGANTGIGFETARSLAFFGCQVLFACRSQSKTEEAIEKIRNERDSGGRCSFIPCDLGSMRSVKQAAELIKKEVNHIDMLILNAAVFALPYTQTEDQLETTFQVCHLAHFYLCKLLEDCLDQNSRVVVVSSESHRFSWLPPSDLSEQILSPPAKNYYSMIAYNNAKLCNVLFARGLAKKLCEKGVCVNALHPGNMVSSSISRNWWFYRFLFAFVRPFTKSLQQAASTTIYVATANELCGVSGQYFNNCFFCEPSQLSRNNEMVDNLWETSEQILDRILQEKGLK